MDFLLVCAVALLAGALTLITGFGLGTLLMPAFAVFFPPHVAVAATAIVHLANSLFKLILVGRWAKWSTVWTFGLPAVAAAILGALLLSAAATLPALLTYSLGPLDARVTPLSLLVGLLILAFAFLETSPTIERQQLPPKYLPLGGLISGFFGGLSGHQGALRTIFLVKLDLDPKQFAGTSSAIAALVDLTRLAVYAAGAAFFSRNLAHADAVSPWLIAAACLTAFTGSALGAQIIKKTTITQLRKAIAIALTLLGIALAAGLV